jgi:hypothetical protein
MTLLDEYRWDNDAQLRRAESVTGGYSTEMASYFGGDGEGDAVEKRGTFKQYLKDHAAPSIEYQNQWTGFDDSSLSDRDLMTMYKPDLKALAGVGSQRARRELDRRAQRRLERKGNRS